MNKSDARYLKSRKAIVETSIQLLLSNPDAGMSEIALAAGVGRATLYRHFETREELIKALTVLCLEETDEALVPIKDQGLTGVDAIIESIKVIVPMAERFRFLMNLNSVRTDDEKINRAYQRQLDELHRYVRQGKKSGEISKSLPTDWIVASYDALLNAAWTLIQYGNLSSDQATQVFVRSFRASLNPPST
ncbi:MAG: TetR/AcrR family transcriptional regulator [Pseudomonadota bacterium]